MLLRLHRPGIVTHLAVSQTVGRPHHAERKVAAVCRLRCPMSRKTLEGRERQRSGLEKYFIRRPQSPGYLPPVGMTRMTIMEPSHENPAQDSIDVTTVQSAVAGDRIALRDIYEATGDRVYRLMVRIVGVQDADDLTQQVYVRAFSKLDQFSGDAKFETWLYRLATNEALQHLRREKRRRTSELVVEPTTRQDDHVERDERAILVRQALAAIDPELRAIFTLKEENGLSYQEIAATLGIPEGTVGSRLNRARRELRKLLS